MLYLGRVLCLVNKWREASPAGHQRQEGQDRGAQCYHSSFCLRNVSQQTEEDLNLCLRIICLQPKEFETSVTSCPGSKKWSSDHQSTLAGPDFKSVFKYTGSQPCLELRSRCRSGIGAVNALMLHKTPEVDLSICPK